MAAHTKILRLLWYLLFLMLYSGPRSSPSMRRTNLMRNWLAHSQLSSEKTIFFQCRPSCSSSAYCTTRDQAWGFSLRCREWPPCDVALILKHFVDRLRSDIVRVELWVASYLWVTEKSVFLEHTKHLFLRTLADCFLSTAAGSVVLPRPLSQLPQKSWHCGPVYADSYLCNLVSNHLVRCTLVRSCKNDTLEKFRGVVWLLDLDFHLNFFFFQKFFFQPKLNRKEQKCIYYTQFL